MAKKEKKEKQEDLEVEVVEEVVELTPEQLLTQENESLISQVATLKSDYLKAYADTENTKKRLIREQEQSMKYRIQSFATSILPVIDNLERALKIETEDVGLRDGVQMVYDQLMASLAAEGVVPIDALNKPFDPNIHQAMVMEDVEGVEPNMVVEEFQKGYLIKDRILRASLVKVSQ